MFGGCGIHLVLHFKHNGNKFHALFGFPENEVSLAPRFANLVVLLKSCVLESYGTHLIKFIFAEHFQALANHFGGLLSLEIFVALNLLIFELELLLIVCFQIVLRQFCFFCFAVNLTF